MTNTNLKGKTILISGGSRGIGLAIAETCAKLEANIVLCSRNLRELEAAQTKIKSQYPSDVLIVACDVSQNSEILKLKKAIEDRFTKLYGVVAAAGVYGSIGKFSETPIDEWTEAININLNGTARTLHAMYPLLLKQKEGRVILFSGGGQGAMPNFSPYVTSKGAIWRMTETLGAEFAADNIYLNAIAPGAVNTKLLDDLIAAGPDKVGSDFYNKSLKQKEDGGQSPEKAAKLVAYLLSDNSRGLYGKTLSAIWDDYENFTELDKMSRSDIYCPRRVVSPDGKTR